MCICSEWESVSVAARRRRPGCTTARSGRKPFLKRIWSIPDPPPLLIGTFRIDPPSAQESKPSVPVSEAKGSRASPCFIHAIMCSPSLSGCVDIISATVLNVGNDGVCEVVSPWIPVSPADESLDERLHRRRTIARAVQQARVRMGLHETRGIGQEVEQEDYADFMPQQSASRSVRAWSN